MSAKSNKKKTMLILVLTLILIVGVGVGVAIWQFIDLKNENNQLRSELNDTSEQLTTLRDELISDPNGAIERSQEERTASILELVGKLYELPEGETPTIATVQDVEKLKEQPFFDGARNGDILIVFDESSTAILFRPDENRLVKVGPINVQPETSSPAAGTTSE